MKYGLLDPMPLDDGEEERFLKCEVCGIEWANIMNDYRNVYNYIRLCSSCHKRFDRRKDGDAK